MTQAVTKDSRLNIRCDDRTRRLLDKAAAYAHLSLSEFVLAKSVEAAEQLVREQESITLEEGDFRAFLAALDGPEEPTPALRRAFARHDRLVDGE